MVVQRRRRGIITGEGDRARNEMEGKNYARNGKRKGREKEKGGEGTAGRKERNRKKVRREL